MSMYKGLSVSERDQRRDFIRKMDDRSKGFSHSQLNDYIDTCMDGFAEWQKLHMAQRILNQYEDKKRMTEMQGDNQESSL